jgi:ElaB/YqjD/DUF883 family membrane-anchored ribosome-binding protein
MHNEGHTQDMALEMREIIRHSQALVEATADEVDERVGKVREALKERLNAAKDKYSELNGHIGDKLRATDELVREKPYHVMGGTLVLGLLLGWMLGRK